MLVPLVTFSAVCLTTAFAHTDAKCVFPCTHFTHSLCLVSNTRSPNTKCLTHFFAHRCCAAATAQPKFPAFRSFASPARPPQDCTSPAAARRMSPQRPGLRVRRLRGHKAVPRRAFGAVAEGQQACSKTIIKRTVPTM